MWNFQSQPEPGERYSTGIDGGMPDDPESSALIPGWVRRWVAWPVLWLLALLLLKLTLNPFLSASLVSVQLSWSRFSAGFRMWWWDINRARGWASGLMYFSYGLVKFALCNAIIAYGLTLLLMLFELNHNLIGNRGLNEIFELVKFNLAGSIVVGAFSVVFLVGSLLTARVSQGKMWLDTCVVRSVCRGEFPPSEFSHNTLDETIRLLWMAEVPTGVILLLFFIGALFGRMMGGVGLGAGIKHILIEIGFVLIGAALLGASYILRVLKQSVTGVTPAEAWPEIQKTLGMPD